MSVVNSMKNIQLPFSISGSSPIESQLFRAYGTLTTAAWRYFHSKKEPHLPEYPKWILTKKTQFQTPRYHFLLPVCTDHSVLSSDSLSGRIRSLLTAGPRSVLLTVSCFHTDCLQVISFLSRCFLSPTESSLPCVDTQKSIVLFFAFECLTLE